jgi:allantoin racemase
MTSRNVAYILPAGDPASLIPPDALTDDVTVDVIENASFLVPTSPAEFLVTEVGVTEAALRADKMGYDGVLLTTPDYGLAAVRSALSIPVVGCAQASMLTAASLADRFSIVTIWPASSGFVNRAVIERNGLEDRCVSVRHVSAEEEMATLGEEDNFYTRTLDRVRVAQDDPGSRA